MRHCAVRLLLCCLIPAFVIIGSGCAGKTPNPPPPTEIPVAISPDAQGLAQLLAEDPATAIARFKNLIVPAEGDTLNLDENSFNRLGYELLGQGRIDDGTAVFKLLTQLKPDSANAWDSLGEAYIYQLDKERSVAAYKKSLELNPENFNAQYQLDSIDGTIYSHQHETQAPFAYQPGEQTGLQGPYLGQTLPGTEPEVFAPGLISTRDGFEFSCTFSPDGKEFYFNREFYISVCRWEDGGWTAPQRAEFNNDNLNHEAHITPDGQRLFWGGRRAQVDGGEEDYGIWFLDRLQDRWGEPQYHGPGMYVTTAQSGNLYLTDINREAGGGLAVQIFENDSFGPLKKIEGGPNSFRTAHPCIAPDESWLVFDGYGPDALGGEGDDDFYVCFRQGDSWTEPIHLPEGISDRGGNMCASVSPDGKYLFFHGRRDIHWVSTQVIEQLRP